MKVDEIIKQVRLRIDEESNNSSYVSDEKDDEYMDNIIKESIPDALHWIAITAASSSILSSSSKTEKKNGNQAASTTTTMKVEQFEGNPNIGLITMPENMTVFNVNRVRAKGWHKAVIPMEDTDDAEAEMFDDTAIGTVEKPMAAIMRVTPLQLLVQPKPTDDEVTISYVGVPNSITTDSDDGSQSVEISETFKSSFIYYLAYLLLSAYEDTKASLMYTIALQQLGVSQTSK